MLTFEKAVSGEQWGRDQIGEGWGQVGGAMAEVTVVSGSLVVKS